MDLGNFCSFGVIFINFFMEDKVIFLFVLNFWVGSWGVGFIDGIELM